MSSRMRRMFSLTPINSFSIMALTLPDGFCHKKIKVCTKGNKLF
jgi:hypothetical protein